MQLSRVVVITALGALIGSAETLIGPDNRLRLTLSESAETVEIRSGDEWKKAIEAQGAPTRVITDAGGVHVCRTQSIVEIEDPKGLLVNSDCEVGRLQRRIVVTSESDVFDVHVTFVPAANLKCRSVEDRFEFAPGRRQADTPTQGPLDFVWSQNLKSGPDDLIPHWGFKSPAVMFQQGPVFAALLPRPDHRVVVPLAIDLDVTSGAKPWFSYGAIPSEPHGHSYFRRSAAGAPKTAGQAIQYAYSMTASIQPERLGYRRVTRWLWAYMGHAALLASNDLQRNYRNPHIELFRDWEQEAWVRYAGEVYREVDCAGGRSCGTLMSNRNVWGDWNKPAPDAWFNSWFQTLRTAYGWYLYGRRTQDASVQRKAESILNLALSSPQKNGVFPTIYLVDEKRWIPEDGWAGFSDSYHTFCMSWNSWWMLQWAKDLTPGRRSQIIGFARPYAGFLVKHQLSSGAIPSWYDAELNPRAEFREFNAETAGSALFLLELGEQTGDRSFIQAGTRAMEFVTREVRPRQRWYDFETFKSCARKSFDFYDRWTAQYPANNLSTIQASMAYLKLYRITKEARWLQLGVEAVDYLLLTQQVWNNPAFSPKLLGGFTTQNTDAEWSDARQCYAATLLLDYYRETGTAEYLERAIAAARSTFAVAPWENWAHTGHIDDRGAMTGIHWGTGSAMASVEIMAPFLGDAFIAVDRKHGAGFNGCALSRLKVEGDTIAFQVEALPRLKSLRVRFAGVDPKRRYRLAANDQAPVTIEGTTLATDGYLLKLPPGK